MDLSLAKAPFVPCRAVWQRAGAAGGLVLCELQGAVRAEAVPASQVFSPVRGVPGRFGAVRDEGKLSLKGDREMCPGVTQEMTPER